MITEADLAHWRRVVPWSTDEQVEQDLALARLIVEIANHPLLGEERVPGRYSIRAAAEVVNAIFDAIAATSHGS